MDIAALAAEHRIRLDHDMQIEIPRLAAIGPGLAFARHAHACAILDTGGNFHFDRLQLCGKTGTVAGRTGSPFQRPCSLTGGTGRGFSQIDTSGDAAQYFAQGQFDFGLEIFTLYGEAASRTGTPSSAK